MSKISQYPVVTDLQDADDLILARDGATKRLTGASMKAAIGGSNGLSGFEQDDATTDLANGIWGYKGGLNQTDNLTYPIAAGTIDLSDQPDDTYFVYLSNSSVVFTSTSNYAEIIGLAKICMLEKYEGCCEFSDLRTWATSSAILTNLAAEQAAEGTTTVIDAGNLTSQVTILTGDTQQNADIGVYRNNIVTGGTGEEALALGNNSIPGARHVFFLQTLTEPGDYVLFPNADFVTGSDTDTVDGVTLEKQYDFLIVEETWQGKWKILYASPGVVSYTPNYTALDGTEDLSIRQTDGTMACTTTQAIADLGGNVSSDDITTIVKLTQAEYDALSPVVSTTLYIIVEA